MPSYLLITVCKKYQLTSISRMKKGSSMKNGFEPFMPDGISRPYHLDESISNLRVVVWKFAISFKI